MHYQGSKRRRYATINRDLQLYRTAHKHRKAVIADGEIKFSGDIIKAIITGADAVMLGSFFAGLEEAPGEVVFFEGRCFKEYQGMGSMGALRGFGKDRYSIRWPDGGKLVPERFEGRVPYKGHLRNYVYQLVGGVRSEKGYAGVHTIFEVQTKTNLTHITNAGLIESHLYEDIITKEAPNYQISD